MGGPGVSESTVNDDGRYWAFISYSHKDAVFGRRLHRRLEAYALPRRLVGRATAQGPVSRRLMPIFRDREELPAASDLSVEVRAALKASRCLIVVCSPAAAVSPWVAREVELFRELHPGRPILAAIREGDPVASIPEVIRRMGPDGTRVEPLAADFRRGHDGWELGLLKLVAGVVGVGLDELVQRDSQRRTQRVTAVTATALAAMLIMIVLTVIAMNARSEAERQRTEAEGLVRFMYTDLRDGLKGVGRLDLMAAVNKRALQHYQSEFDRLSPASQAQFAQVEQAIGEDDEDSANPAMAIVWFQRAWEITNALLAKDPNDADRIFGHAQSEYWLGFEDYFRGNLTSTKRHFANYLQLARRLIVINPKNPEYLRELAFAERNLCSVNLKKPANPKAALDLCKSALQHMAAASRARSAPRGIAVDLSDTESWLGSAYRANFDNARALEHWLVQQKILEGVMEFGPPNMDRRSEWISLQRLLARLDAEEGRKGQARDRLQNAAKLLDEMILFDPRNRVWSLQRLKLTDEIKKLEHK